MSQVEDYCCKRLATRIPNEKTWHILSSNTTTHFVSSKHIR